MLNKLSIQKLGLYLVLMILGIFIGLYLGGIRIETATAAVVNQPKDVLAAPEEPAAQHVCVPENIAIFTNRIHIKCTIAASEGIRYFALSTNDSKHTARVLSLLLTAKASGQRVGVDYNPNDLSGGAIGCSTTDCRLIRWVYIIN